MRQWRNTEIQITVTAGASHKHHFTTSLSYIPQFNKTVSHLIQITTWFPMLNGNIWIQEIIYPRFPIEKKKKQKQAHPLKAPEKKKRKRLHWLSLFEYTQSKKEKKVEGKGRGEVGREEGMRGEARVNLEIKCLNFVALFLTASEKADHYLHTYHHLCFFPMKTFPAWEHLLRQ